MNSKTVNEIEERIGRAVRESRRMLGAEGRRAGAYAAKKVSEIERARAPLSRDNWYHRAATACEAVGDAILNSKPGTSQRVVKVAAGKLGMIGVPAALMTVASVLGTASTGTAIGTLSGAAFNSAALAWVGGSMAVGGLIVAIAGVAGGLGALLGAGWVGQKYLFGRKRKETDLNGQERRILEASLALALAFRNEEKAGRKIDSLAAQALYNEALKPLCDELLEYRTNTQSWPVLAKKRFRDAKDRLESAASFALAFSRRNPNLTTGIVGAVITQLLADDLPAFTPNEHIVLDALRRSKSSLENATDAELAAYVQSLEPGQLQGLENNLLGLSHELRYYVQENSDGDQYVVELFDLTNHSGADVKITNTLTGEIREVQLKASNYRAYVEQHSQRYADIPVMATDELAGRMDGVASTDISHEDLTDDVDNVVSGLREVDDPGVLSSMSVAGMVALARNVKVLLKGKSMSREKKEGLVQDGTRSALVSGLVHTVIG